MRQIILAIGFAAILATLGCGNDPASSRLDPGSEAILRQPKYIDPSPTKTHLDDVLIDSPDHLLPIPVVGGIKVRVVADSEPSYVSDGGPIGTRDIDGKVDRRPVLVRVIEGEHDGLTGKVGRNQIRPIVSR